MKKQDWYLVLLVACAAFLVGFLLGSVMPACAGTSARLNGKLVSVGDEQSRVLAKWGLPDFSEVIAFDGAVTIGAHPYSSYDEWVYIKNSRINYRVSFRGGMVSKILIIYK